MPRTTSPWVVLLGFVLAGASSFAACGSSEADDRGSDAGLFADGFPDPAAFELFFDPPEATLVVDASGPKQTRFILKATSHGITREVTPEALAFDRPDIAKLELNQAPGTMTAFGTYAGTGTLKGALRGKEATAKLHVRVVAEEIGHGVEPAAIAALKATPLGADPAVKNLLYPYDATVFPLGLTAPLLMWNAPGAGDTVRVHLEQSNYAYDGFFVVGSPGQQRVTQVIWDRMTASNAGDPLKLDFSRYDASAKVAYATTQQSWPIAHSSLRGAIYYWTTSQGGHMSSIRPGTGASPQVLNGGKCMGCHAVSADGTTLVATVEVAGDVRPWETFSLPTVSSVYKTDDQNYAANVAVNPDGTYVVYGKDMPLRLSNAKTGQAYPTSGLETFTPITGNDGYGMPAFSPTGRRFAAIEGKLAWPNMAGDKDRLIVADFDPAGPTFTNMRGLAGRPEFPGDEHFLAYPSFSPDGEWIAFHVGDHTTGCYDGCGETPQPRARIWMQHVSGAPLVELKKLNDSSLNSADHDRTFEPTFNPVERGGFHWVVVTSARDWGNQLVGAPSNAKRRLWVAAIDATKGAGDPSHPAFFLEGQEAETMNMRGFWTLAQCTPTLAGGLAGATADSGSACGAGFECCSGFCDQGVCVDVGQVACVKTGGACTSDAECCDSPTVKCNRGVCQNPGPK